MQSIIIAAINKADRQTHTEMLLRNLSISPFDITIIEETALGIEDVRKMRKIAFLTPLKGKNKAIVLRYADSLTIDAQNALLKILEEPPEDTLIILESEKSDNFLPTICSRCKIIFLHSETKKPVSYKKGILKELFSKTAGEKLKFAQDNGKSKEEACDFLKQVIITLHLETTNHYNDTYHYSDFNLIKIMKRLQKTYTIIETTNVSPRFTLEELLLSF